MTPSNTARCAAKPNRNHRFLKDRQPQSEDKRVWVITGHTNDIYYYNIYHGCLGLRATVGRWATDSDLLVITVTRDGALSFADNPDPAEAQARYEGTRSDRPRRYQNTFTPSETAPESAATQPPIKPAPAPHAVSDREAAQQQTADSVRNAATATGQPLLNLFLRLTEVLRSSKLPVLLMVEDFAAINTRLLSAGQQAAASDMRDQISRVWVHSVAPCNLIVFLTAVQSDGPFFSHPERGLLPPSPYVRHLLLPAPDTVEILAALRRLARRHHFPIVDPASVARLLLAKQSLKMALQRVAQLVHTDIEVNTVQVAALPPINAEQIRRVYADLDALTGLQTVKDALRKLESGARDRRRKMEMRGDLPDSVLHMIFMGPPGTGKTTVAHIVARFFHAAGLLPRPDVVTVRPNDIISPFEGRTGLQMRETIERAIGGVLFLDEAHQLGGSDGKSDEAVKALVPLLWDHRHELVVILAGYEHQIDDLMQKDEGLSRRFPPALRIAFPDYSIEELMQIMRRTLTRHSLPLETAEPGVEGRLRALLQKRSARSGFGNAGGVELLVDEIGRRHSARIGADDILAMEDLPPFLQRNHALYQEAQAKLDTLVGLEPVRREIDSLIKKIRFATEEMEEGRSDAAVIRVGNMCFVGPPGVGKTTVARLMADLLYSIGAIERQHCTEARREHLVGRYVGETAQKIAQVIRKARGGVLFIDEAYALCTGDRDEFGREAVNTLVGQMTDPENQDTVFILAGYERPIDEFIAQNDGLARRFGRTIRFPNFAPDACAELARQLFARENYTTEAGIIERIRLAAEEVSERQGERFGNAAWVAGVVGRICDAAQMRIVESVPVNDAVNRRRILLVDAQSVLPTMDAPEVWTPRTTASHATSDKAFTGVSGEIARHMRPAIWQVATDGGVGTGFTVTCDGVIATCAHVVADAASVRVYNEAVLRAGGAPDSHANFLPARVIHRDTNLDIALLICTADLPVEAMHAGQSLFLPLGESRSVPETTPLITCGYAHAEVGSIGRVTEAQVARNSTDTVFIEVAGAIEPGFSGGPAMSTETGTVVGMVHGGRGVSATYLIRSERIRDVLSTLGYRFESSQ